MFRLSMFLMLATLLTSPARSNPTEKLEKEEQSTRKELIRREEQYKVLLEELIVHRHMLLLQLQDIRRKYPELYVDELGTKLGAGTYGTVHETLAKGRIYALKRFHIRCPGPETCPPWCAHYWSAIENSLTEMKVMSTIQGEANVMSPISYRQPDGTQNPGIYMPRMQMDLAKFLKNHARGLPHPILQRILVQMVAGVAALHAQGFVHCDLKPSNFLIDYNGNVKVSDFDSINSRVSTAGEIGTLWYRAPEWILKGDYDATADIFSLACIFFEFLKGRPLFRSKSELAQLLDIFKLCGTPSDKNWPNAKTRSNYPTLSPQWQEHRWKDSRTRFCESKFGAPCKYTALLAAMLNLDPALRPSAADILEYLRPKKGGPYTLPASAAGFEVVDVDDDGDCGFHAVAAAYKKEPIDRQSFVKKIFDLYQSELILPDSPLAQAILAAIQSFLPNGTTMDDHEAIILWLQALSQRLWLSHADLAVMAFLYDFTLVIHTPGLEPQMINPGQEQTIHIGHVATDAICQVNHYVLLLPPAGPSAPAAVDPSPDPVDPSSSAVLAPISPATPDPSSPAMVDPVSDPAAPITYATMDPDAIAVHPTDRPLTPVEYPQTPTSGTSSPQVLPTTAQVSPSVSTNFSDPALSHSVPPAPPPSPNLSDADLEATVLTTTAALNPLLHFVMRKFQ
ncbi:MAG: protein kinase [Oligoflexales bacterium]|nr:protein kinase [Oligoflexales bacterium]